MSKSSLTKKQMAAIYTGLVNAGLGDRRILTLHLSEKAREDEESQEDDLTLANATAAVSGTAPYAGNCTSYLTPDGRWIISCV